MNTIIQNFLQVWERIHEFTAGKRICEVVIKDEKIFVHVEWEEICMGYAEREDDAYEIPFGVFFSDTPAKEWLKEDQEAKRILAQQESARQRDLENAEREEEERKTFDRLKAKFEPK